MGTPTARNVAPAGSEYAETVRSSHCKRPNLSPRPLSALTDVAAVAEWYRYRYRIVACLVTSSSPVPLKIRRVGKRCTLNLSRTETSSRWCGS
ncbi:hypothetical protein TNCV_166851 [Trichonephila clavipes]|nr:hypothetical protein TNCV_166851 [Trichonephila clavipes]